MTHSRVCISAPVEGVDPQDVDGGQVHSLSDRHCCIRNRSDGVPPVDGESGFPIVHHGGVVVWCVEVVGVLLVEIVLHRWRDIFPVDPHVAVAVTPGLLVVETQRVVQLVLDDAVVHAAVPVQGDHLLPS